MSPIMRGPPLYAGIYGCKTIDSSIVEWVGFSDVSGRLDECTRRPAARLLDVGLDRRYLLFALQGNCSIPSMALLSLFVFSFCIC